jgi:SpoVK/Ycf46/Vps4 family AAA+-type ATPase
MDGAHSDFTEQVAQRGGARLVVVAASNRPGAVDKALRRPGRFDREVMVPVPGPSQRTAILRLHARSMPLHADVSLAAVAARCHGYTGACQTRRPLAPRLPEKGKGLGDICVRYASVGNLQLSPKVPM